jgi:CII-binding regulator of phage lambda lysogenization HflD
MSKENKQSQATQTKTQELEAALKRERELRLVAERKLEESKTLADQLQERIAESESQCSKNRVRREELRGELMALKAENDQLKIELAAAHEREAQWHKNKSA